MHDRLLAALDQGQEIIYLTMNDPWHFVPVSPARDQNIGIRNDLPQSSLVGPVCMAIDWLRLQQADGRCSKGRDVADDESTCAPYLREPDPLANRRVISDRISNAWVDSKEGVDRARQGDITI